MLTVWRWFLAVVLLAGLVFRLGGAEAPSPEERAFIAAAQAFEGGFFERADKELEAFAQQFPASARVPEAVLMQAQARVQLKNYAGAIELLSARLATAGTWMDQYLFWLGEAHNRQDQYAQAADYFARLVREQTNSSRRLEAAVAEAAARSKLAQWPQVVALLQDSNSVVQVTGRSNPTNGLVVRGFLLLSEAYLAQGQYGPPKRHCNRWRAFRCIPAGLAATACALPQSVGGNRAEEAWSAAAISWCWPPTQPNRNCWPTARRFERASSRNSGGSATPSPRIKTTWRTACPPSGSAGAVENQLAGAGGKRPRASHRHPRAVLCPASGRAGRGPRPADRWRVALAPVGRPGREGGGGRGGSRHQRRPRYESHGLAQAAFSEFVSKFPQSPLLGKAQLDLGWCLWTENRWAESRAAFQAATTNLPAPSVDLAVAYFKLGDVCFQEQDYTNALANYRVIREKFAGIEEVRTNLLEPALYQEVRVALAAGDVTSAARALTNILGSFPEGFHAERALLLVGSELGRKGNPAAARQLFEDFLQRAPAAPLLPELRLGVARTYEREGKWTEVIAAYDQWLGQFTNHPARPRAEYDRAWACWQAGLETNALTGFTNFVAQYPAHELAPLAQRWVADYFFRNGDPFQAEKNYQLLYKSTNWPPSRITYEAQLLAGRAAMARLSWEDADDYFTQLYNDTNCPYLDLRVQALVGYGDYWISRDSTNKVADYDQAIGAFNGILSRHPTNRLAVLALGKIASCYLQRALASQDYELSRTNFLQVIAATNADVTARSIATVGLAVVWKSRRPWCRTPRAVGLAQAGPGSLPGCVLPQGRARGGDAGRILDPQGGVGRRGAGRDPPGVGKRHPALSAVDGNGPCLAAASREKRSARPRAIGARARRRRLKCGIDTVRRPPLASARKEQPCFAPNQHSGIFLELWPTQYWSAPNGATKAKAKLLTCSPNRRTWWFAPKAETTRGTPSISRVRSMCCTWFPRASSAKARSASSATAWSWTPSASWTEIEGLRKLGVRAINKNLFLSEPPLVFPYHRELDRAARNPKGRRRSARPSAASSRLRDKAARTGLRGWT
jgi:TolA-binding protein